MPVEVMASGRPVIAYGRGGALDTVVDRETGLLFYEQSIDAMIDAVETFEAEQLADLDPMALVAHARRFDEAAFRCGLGEVLRAQGIPLRAAEAKAG